MLRVHTVVVGDRPEIDACVRVVVRLQQFAHRLPLVMLRADRAEPEPKE
jgi:hypothetical protein